MMKEVIQWYLAGYEGPIVLYMAEAGSNYLLYSPISKLNKSIMIMVALKVDIVPSQ